MKGTKEAIFDVAVQLISAKGFESVNMREIASGCSIKAASIYNHFKNKQEILDTIYAYYRKHFFDNRSPEEYVRKIILNGTKEEIIKAVVFTFENEDLKKYQRMVFISKIIYMRVFEDKTAQEIFSGIMTSEPEEYVQSLMRYGIENGRFKPFDYRTFSQLLIGCRHNMAIKAFSEADYLVKQLDEETRLDMLLCGLLPLTEN